MLIAINFFSCNTGNTETIPSFVGSDYYCESGIASGDWSRVLLHAKDPLWDGQKSGVLERPCCNNPKMPWYIKTLDENTTQDIELRVMADEDIPLHIIKLYIH